MTNENAVPNVDDPFAAIHAACETQIDNLVAPSKAKLMRVRALLDAFEANLRLRAQNQVMARVHAALGQPPPSTPDVLDDIEEQLFAELDSLVPDWAEAKPVVSPQPTQRETVPVSVVRIIPPKTHTTPEPTAEDIATAKALISEIERTDYSAGHPLRMAPLMQAHAAEIRCALLRIPERHPVGWQLTQLVSRLARAKTDANIQPFIRGLSRNNRPTDWARLALESRKQVARFDVDAETSNTAPAPAKKTKKAAKEDDRQTIFNWPSLPNLRERLTKGPLIFAGGVAVPNKLSSIQTRFGIAAEWHPIEDSSPRAVSSLVEKIRKGKVGAVVLLTGLLGHDAWRSIFEACKASGVPCAAGDKGGLGDVQMALDGLEKAS